MFKHALYPRFSKNVFFKTNSIRKSSINLTTHPKNSELAIVELNQPPVNSMGKTLLTDLHDTIVKIENDDQHRAIILTSANPGIFCAGLDLLELHNKSEQELSEFWSLVQKTCWKLYGTKLATIASINGASPAGGCLLALTCDYRVMADFKRAKIGLNESQLGLTVPDWLGTICIDAIGQRLGERALVRGTLFSTEEALAVGMIDELVGVDDVQEAALRAAESYLKVPELARSNVKVNCRAKNMDLWSSIQDKDSFDFGKMAGTPEAQATIKHVVESLKRRK